MHVVVSQVEALLASEDYGKDLASVNNLLKKHQLLEADISAHEVSNSLLQMAQQVGQLYLRVKYCRFSHNLELPREMVVTKLERP